MTTIAPSVLERVASILGRSSLHTITARALDLAAKSQIPMIGVERYAASRAPAITHPPHDDSPFLITFEGGPTADGPLGGARVIVKDSIDVAGAPTGLGLMEGGDVARADAVIVARVRAAGGLICGKAKMTELGMDGIGTMMHAPMPQNPRAPGYAPGGSSTGTAVAVAAGLARYGLGGDGLGSVRIPAAFCGLVGLKPTHDKLPAEGYPSPAPSMDVPGPMAKTAEDCARLWQVMAGEPVTALSPHRPARVGVIRGLGPEIASRSIQAAFARVLHGLGSEVVRVTVEGASHNPGLGMAAAIYEVANGPYASRRLSPSGQLNLVFGRALRPAHQAIFAERRRRLRDAMLRAFERAEVIAMPTTAVPPPAVTPALLRGAQDGLLLRAIGAYTPLANCTGLPAIAVPCGEDDIGRPLSIMFVGAPGSEATLLRIAMAVEANER